LLQVGAGALKAVSLLIDSESQILKHGGRRGSGGSSVNQ
jgi:hypothetical protein